MSIVTILKKIGKIFLYFIGTIIALLAILIIVIRFNSSSGSQNPFKDEAGNVLPNSIALQEDKIINGVPQRLIIRGADINNPVLLRIHGGPGGNQLPRSLPLPDKCPVSLRFQSADV